MKALEDKIFESINRARVRRSKPVLVRGDAETVLLARKHSKEMADVGALQQADPPSSLLADSVQWRQVRVNVGRATTVQALHKAFMASDPHRYNMMARVTHTQIGVHEKDGWIWATVILWEKVK